MAQEKLKLTDVRAFKAAEAPCPGGCAAKAGGPLATPLQHAPSLILTPKSPIAVPTKPLLVPTVPIVSTPTTLAGYNATKGCFEPVPGVVHGIVGRTGQARYMEGPHGGIWAIPDDDEEEKEKLKGHRAAVKSHLKAALDSAKDPIAKNAPRLTKLQENELDLTLNTLYEMIDEEAGTHPQLELISKSGVNIFLHRNEHAYRWQSGMIVNWVLPGQPPSTEAVSPSNQAIEVGLRASYMLQVSLDPASLQEADGAVEGVEITSVNAEDSYAADSEGNECGLSSEVVTRGTDYYVRFALTNGAMINHCTFVQLDLDARVNLKNADDADVPIAFVIHLNKGIPGGDSGTGGGGG